MIEVSGIRLSLDEVKGDIDLVLKRKVASLFRLNLESIGAVKLLKKSIDARKSGVAFVVTCAVTFSDEIDETKLRAPAHCHIKPHQPYRPLSYPHLSLKEGACQPFVVGSGPAGLCAALYLARSGLAPLIIERGAPVDERCAIVDAFNKGADLDPVSNIQFGEGGAGTFSDGKLTTGIKSPLKAHVLHMFVEAGAPKEILYQAKPHIGTDYLRKMVKRIREHIEDAGGRFMFYTQLADLVFDEQGKVCEVVIKDTKTKERSSLPCREMILACGHSARDTLKMLKKNHFDMERKPFSVGVRIEHLQERINKVQYGPHWNHPALGAAEYKLVEHLPNKRSVYTFCMCPGGEVVPAASEDFGVVVNGMSTYARDKKNANSALLVGVLPDDCPGNDVLSGMYVQRQIEQLAYGEVVECGGKPWQAPAQTVGDFLSCNAGNPSKMVEPSYARGVVWCDLYEVLPQFVADSLSAALPRLDKKLSGFAHPEAVMTGVETRSSSPVRVMRNVKTLQASRTIGLKKVRPRDIARGHGAHLRAARRVEGCGVYPAGEGAGYAGGIMSAAVDGLKVAEAVVRAHGQRP